MIIERAEKLIGKKVRVARDLYDVQFTDYVYDKCDMLASMEDALDLMLSRGNQVTIESIQSLHSNAVFVNVPRSDENTGESWILSCYVNCKDLEEIK